MIEVCTVYGVHDILVEIDDEIREEFADMRVAVCLSLHVL